jgi:hypothetical protein
MARKRDLTALLAAADSGHVEVFRELLKHGNCVVISIKKFLELINCSS